MVGRLTGGDAACYKATGIGGTVGLAVAIGLGYASTKLLPGVLPLLAILSPGGVAAIAARGSQRGRPAAEQMDDGRKIVAAVGGRVEATA